MEAKTKTEKDVVRLSELLKPIGDRDKERAKKMFRAVGFNTGRKTHCHECGSVFKSLDGVNVQCPVCGRMLEVEESKRRSEYALKYYSIYTTREIYQIERVMTVEKEWRKGSPATFSFNEVYQVWTSEKGKTLFMSRYHSCNWYYFRWYFKTPMTLKGRLDFACHGTSHMHRIERILPVLRRNGFTGDFKGCNSVMLFKWLLREPWFETLWKIGLGKKALDDRRYQKYFKQILYCRKQGYDIKDYSLWFDMLRSMEELNAPTHCGEHLCPKNLRKTHDMWQRRVEKMRARKAREERMRRLEEEEKTYASTHAKFIGIVFDYQGINYHVLENVREFMTEGDAMHHCVYSNSYYLYKNCVILSARNDTGRLATIEIDTKKWRVEQCRGVCNSKPPMYEEIVNGVIANMGILKHASRRKLKTA